MRARNLARIAALALLVLVAACDEQNPFQSIDEDVDHGASQLWELGLDGFPSGFDIPTGERFFVGPSTVLTTFGSFVLDTRSDGTLMFRAYGTLVSGFSSVRTGIQDLGTRSFEVVETVPEGGYSSPGDSLGVPVVAGHTYAFRLSVAQQGVVFINYAKLHVQEVSPQFPQDPRSRFVRFEYAYQEQPLNRNVAVEEDTGP